MDLVEKTWQEYGKKIRPLGKRVVVRTFPVSNKTESGLLFLPRAEFYDGMANQKVIKAMVLSVGAKVTDVKAGDVIAFTRLVFARFEQLEDKTYIGYVDNHEIIGHVTED